MGPDLSPCPATKPTDVHSQGMGGTGGGLACLPQGYEWVVGTRSLVAHEGFILPVLVAKSRSLRSMFTSPSHLSRLRLQDRIRIVPLDVTSGTFPTHLPWGGHPGDRCCWVDEALCRAGGRASRHLFTHSRMHRCTHTRTHKEKGYLRPVLAEGRQVSIASWADLTRGLPYFPNPPYLMSYLGLLIVKR